jgi:hypothetical protein
MQKIHSPSGAPVRQRRSAAAAAGKKGGRSRRRGAGWIEARGPGWVFSLRWRGVARSGGERGQGAAGEPWQRPGMQAAGADDI